MLSKVKNKTRSPFLHKSETDILSELKFYSQQCFPTSLKVKGNFHISKSTKCALGSSIYLQLEVINLQRNDLLKENSKRRPTEFYKCLPSDEQVQLKSPAYGRISVCGWNYLSEKTFSKVKYVKSHFINRRPFEISFNDREHQH